MRITDSYMSSNFINNLQSNLKNLSKVQNQLSSLKEVSKSSDDPMLVSEIMDLNDSIIQNKEYMNTIEDSIDFSNMQDTAYDAATKSMSRIRTLIQQAGTDTVNNEDRQLIKAEVEAEIQTLTDALNTNFGGKYVFSGMETTTKPFTFSTEKDPDGKVIGLTYAGTDNEGVSGNLTRRIAQGVQIELRTDGRKLLNEQGVNGEKDNLGTFLSDALSALEKGDVSALSGDLLARADKEIDNIVTQRAENGAIFNRLEASKERNTSENLNLESMRSDKQDIDLAEKFMEYTMEQTAYQASLAMGTKILSTSILDYI
ncbi:flagellar hook-associated protein 3 [Desemzia sp. C1]|uniref:flagellin N-terminal helical domain-containing protein n=1 Tax=Desemzia sp. C1 TaxID=2892016 RepID=UPI001E2A2409|nr:flagellin [Desemzia sp. C1]MCI3028107.1 flagellar hook-associated protein 3 [Desemzia sp. C1]